DAHFNFQLAKDFSRGLTATCVIFEQGQIRSYQPGGFAEFEVARYAFAAGQRRFLVHMELDVEADRC
ncbi:MAG: hypothetical protein B7Z55_16135, partial [Planctomycetales bacterium 12-60-4]